MNLDRELRDPLVELVALYLGDSPFQVGHSLLGHRAMRHWPPTGVNTPFLARWVVRFVLSARTPDLFIRLVKEVDVGGALEEVHAVAAQLGADPSTWTADVAQGLWVPRGWPFIDRAPVRETLGAMAEGGGPASLAIEGPFGHGKKTIGEYVRTLADDTEGFEPAIVELRP